MGSQRVGHNKVVKQRGAGAQAHGKQLQKQTSLPSPTHLAKQIEEKEN